MERPIPKPSYWSGTAIITGAGAGIGASMARRFAAAGMSIVAIDIDAARAEETAEAVRAGSGNAIAIGSDVSDRAALIEAARVAEQAFGDCNVLCSNVGVQQFGRADRISEDEWRWLLGVNVIGAANTVAAFLPLIRKASGRRHILLTSSVSVLMPGVRLGAYAVSKAAVVAYGETLRLELAPDDIGVSVLFPAGMTSRYLEHSAEVPPAALGGAIMAPDDLEALVASRKVETVAEAVDPDHATRNLLAELQENAEFIVTHGAFGERLAKRSQALLDAVERAGH